MNLCCIEKLYGQLLEIGIASDDDQKNDMKKKEDCATVEESLDWQRVLQLGNIVDTMKGFCGVVFRIQLGEERIVVKLATPNGKMRNLLKDQYRNEVDFCKWLMKKQMEGKSIENLPNIFASGYLKEDEHLFYIVMEDFGDGELNQLSNCSAEEAIDILRCWKGVQRNIGTNLSDLNVRDLFYSFINGVLFFEFHSIEPNDNTNAYVDMACSKMEENWSTFMEVIKELDWTVYDESTLLDFRTLIQLPKLVDNVRKALAHIQKDKSSVIHGDFRLDNIIKKGNNVAFIDFQSVSRGPLAYDLSHFTAQSLSIQTRRTLEDLLLREYFESNLDGDERADGWNSFIQSYKHCVVLQMCYCVLGIGSHWKHYLQSGKLKDPQFLQEKSARVGKDIIARTCHLYIDHFQ